MHVYHHLVHSIYNLLTSAIDKINYNHKIKKCKPLTLVKRTDYLPPINNNKYCKLTVVSGNLLPTPSCTRVRHRVSGVRGGASSPVLHRVTSDHLTRSKCRSAPSDSDLPCFIQWHH